MSKATTAGRGALVGEDACAHAGHPLELIPYFRRFERGALRNLLYPFIWNTLFAALPVSRAFVHLFRQM
jgi:hypothetical protein